MSIRIALAGNPNSGKTTMFNDLTGSSQYVGNWPGVTVEKKEGKLRSNKEILIQDLPGIYSLSPYTLEEVVARNYLINESPDAILNIVDGTNIERNLYLTTQLCELGIPVVIALNMMDIVQKQGDVIDVQKLSETLGCPVVETSALKGTGSQKAAETALSAARSAKAPQPLHFFGGRVEHAVAHIEDLVAPLVDSTRQRWYAIKLFERDEKVADLVSIPKGTADQIEALIQECEAAMDDDSESIITNERYAYIGKVMSSCVRRARAGDLTTSDKIDRVVTNRWLALPIFAVVMFLVYYLAVSTVGTMLTDWVNDGVFGDGFHLTGGAAYEEAVGDFELSQAKLDAFTEAAEAAGLDPDSAEAAGLTAALDIEDEDGSVEDTVLVTAADYQAALAAEEPDPADFGTWVRGIPVVLGDWLESAGTADWLSSLILDGIVAGVGAVLGFLPQMMVLFLLLAFLEDCGYMARIAFIMDRIFRKFGLSGKSFIPMLIGTGCGVPGIMASRTIENDRDRKMTIITTTFIPCGAKLPIIALIAGALFGGAWWVGPSAYFLGIAAIICSGIILKKTKLFAGDPAPFVMELPAYHMPGFKGLIIHMWDRSKAFVKKAGTIIFLSCGVVWFLGAFNWRLQMVDTNESILAAIGGVIAPLFAPLGFGDWRSAVATVTGLVAKENVVGTFGVLFGFAEVAEDGAEIWGTLASSFTTLSAYAFLIFNLLCAPCFAAIGAIRREMGSGKWTWIAIGYQTGLAYGAALVFYQLGTLFTGGGFGLWTAVAIVLLIGFLYLLLRPSNDPEDRMRKRSAASLNA